MYALVSLLRAKHLATLVLTQIAEGMVNVIDCN